MGHQVFNPARGPRPRLRHTIIITAILPKEPMPFDHLGYLSACLFKAKTKYTQFYYPPDETPSLTAGRGNQHDSTPIHWGGVGVAATSPASHHHDCRRGQTYGKGVVMLSLIVPLLSHARQSSLLSSCP